MYTINGIKPYILKSFNYKEIPHFATPTLSINKIVIPYEVRNLIKCNKLSRFMYKKSNVKC